jgi:hypothetical protein
MCILCPTCSKWTMTASDKKVATIGEELYKFVSVQWFYIDKKIYMVCRLSFVSIHYQTGDLRISGLFGCHLVLGISCF